jgi:hypothetical protein
MWPISRLSMIVIIHPKMGVIARVTMISQPYDYDKFYDNLFNAEHRDLMIEKHGGTMAQVLSVEDLMNLREYEKFYR